MTGQEKWEVEAVVLLDCLNWLAGVGCGAA